MGRRRAGRKLAAILAADVAGYSRLTRADEEGTIARLRTLRRELIEPAIDAHRGRIVKTTGDGILIEFASAVDAVRCAVVVQREMASRSKDVPEEKRIVFRVGINVGDVLIESDGDLMGDGINVASRLEGQAEPGGICLSGAAYEQVRDKIAHPFTDMGEQWVKNIDRPVHVYSLVTEAIAALPDEPVMVASISSQALVSHRLWRAISAIGVVVVLVGGAWFGIDRHRIATTAPPLSIVVLPFSNLSGDAKQDYFADAITEDVTTDLSRIRGSFVIAHNTADAFKGKPVDVRQVAKELGVRYVLEGSVQRDGSVVRARAQFVDGNSGEQLWADRFDSDLTNLFKLQSQISGRIANSLRLEMTSAAGRNAQTRGANIDAQDYVMRARALNTKPQTRDSLEQQLSLYQHALAIEANSADAWAGLARTLANIESIYPDENRGSDLRRAEAAADRAVALDSANPEAHHASGEIDWQVRRLAEAEVELETAIKLDHNYAAAYFNLGVVEAFRGAPDKALPLMEQAVSLSPRDPYVSNYLGGISWCYLLLGDDNAAVDWGLKGRSANPNYPPVNVGLAAAYALLGDMKNAHASLADALRLNPHLSIRLLQEWGDSPDPAYVKLAQRMYDGLRKAGLPEQ